MCETRPENIRLRWVIECFTMVAFRSSLRVYKPGGRRGYMCLSDSYAIGNVDTGVYESKCGVRGRRIFDRRMRLII